MEFVDIRNVDYDSFNQIEEHCHLLSLKEIKDRYENLSVVDILLMKDEAWKNNLTAYISLTTLQELEIRLNFHEFVSSEVLEQGLNFFKDTVRTPDSLSAAEVPPKPW